MVNKKQVSFFDLLTEYGHVSLTLLSLFFVPVTYLYYLALCAFDAYVFQDYLLNYLLECVEREETSLTHKTSAHRYDSDEEAFN